MTIQQLLELIVHDRGPIFLIVISAMTCVQVAPIQINPWDMFFKWVGGRLNKEVIEKIDDIEARLDAHIRDSEANELKVRRSNILDFGSSVIRGVNYHKEKFEFMIAECDSYEKYCQENNIKNGVAEASIAEIRKIYEEHYHNNDFLTESLIKEAKRNA